MAQAEDQFADGADEEFMELPSDDSVTETEDGGALVRLDDGDGPDSEDESDPDFYANLADGVVDESELASFASELLELIDEDDRARDQRDKDTAEAIKRTGLGDDAPGGASFEGASKAVHPGLLKAAIEYSSRVMKEIFPPDGPVKDKIPGDKPPTQQMVDKARRKSAYMNHQFTEEIVGFREELEQCQTQVPIGGGEYMKLWWNAAKKRPDSAYVPSDKVLIPAAASSYYSAERKTHIIEVTKHAFDDMVAAGVYRDLNLVTVSMVPEQTATQEATDKVDGVTPSVMNIDKERTLYEVSVSLSVKKDRESGGEPSPYLITIDKDSRKVVSLYRNWEPGDDRREELLHMVQFPFVPFRGAYPLSLKHLIGGLSSASTGALRALLDAAHISNMQGAFKLKGGIDGENVSVGPGEVAEVDGGLGVDDIRKLIMPAPVNPPSPVLFNLLGLLADETNSVVRTTLQDFADSSTDVPVGTTIARIEQGMAVFNAIHARQHDAMGRLMRILHRINKQHLDEAEVAKRVGENMQVKRSDFEGPMDVIPVSDPHIFSETQRFSQANAVAQRAVTLPMLYDLRKVELMWLERMRVPGGKDLLLPAQQPTETNAANENVAAMLGRPITAFPEQSHESHIESHLAFMQTRSLGMNKLIAPKFLPVMLQHIVEHVGMLYAAKVYEVACEAAGFKVEEAQRLDDPKVKARLDDLIAAAAPDVLQHVSALMERIQPVLDAAQQLLASLPKPPVPMDPTQAAMAETQRKARADQQKASEGQQKLGLQAQAAQIKQQTENRRLDLDERRLAADQQQAAQHEDREDKRTELEVGARVDMNTADNETALTLATMEIESGERVAVSTGTGINPGGR